MGDAQLVVEKPEHMSRCCYESIVEAHRRFVEEGDIPGVNDCVRPEIVDSWIRSKKAGVDPFATDLDIPITPEEAEEIAFVYSRLTEATLPFLALIDELDLAHDYIFELISRNGMTLLCRGNLDLHSIMADRACMNEGSMGTNAHTLCMRQKTALCVMGAEHYCIALHGLTGIAAPITDNNGVVIASLLLTQPLPEEPWSGGYGKLVSHAMAFIASLASAIERQLVYESSVEELAMVDERLEEEERIAQATVRMLGMTVNSSSRSLLVIDADGRILHASPEAVRQLRMTMPAVVGADVAQVLGVQWPEGFRPLVEGGPGTALSIQTGGRMLDVRANAARGDVAGNVEGMVLTLEFRADVGEKAAAKVGEVASIHFEDILGRSDAMAKVRTLAYRYAMSNENVLLVGESGTGKELFSQAIHNASRPKGPFMSVNCAAIPPRLIESELFGYESGAFTGAERGGKPGKIELAHNGTLFLDEIGDMPLELQATLLRVLENKRVMRLGGKSYKQIDFRVVAATNRDLSTMVADGLFREDLLYRLSILTVPLPPLRQRDGDVRFFAYYFLNECNGKAHGGPTQFSEDALKVIEAYGWPGNVRQMKNVIYASFYACANEEIDVEDLPAYLRDGADGFGRVGLDGPIRLSGKGPNEPHLEEADSKEGASEEGFAAKRSHQPASQDSGMPRSDGGGEVLRLSDDMIQLRDLEESAIKVALVRTEGNMTRAAELLGISKATLYRKVKEYHLR